MDDTPILTDIIAMLDFQYNFEGGKTGTDDVNAGDFVLQ